MRAALVNLKTKTIENVIVADALIDEPSPGYVLIYLPDYAVCSPGEAWTLKILSPRVVSNDPIPYPPPGT